MFRFLLFASLAAYSIGASPRLRRPRLDGRIVGGEDANIEDYPYQLSFEYINKHRCGASIISDAWVVTAAHCVDGTSVSHIKFRAGSSVVGTGGTLHPAAQVIPNPQYDYYTVDFDVAVVQVSDAFTFAPGVQPIPLTKLDSVAGETAVVTGWGTRSSGSTTVSTQLQAVNVTIVSREECSKAYTEYGGITENMICAGVPDGGKDACQGDSGGPLTVNGVLVGIVSWGVGCGEASYPGVYTRVADMRGFITEQSGVN